MHKFINKYTFSLLVLACAAWIAVHQKDCCLEKWSEEFSRQILNLMGQATTKSEAKYDTIDAPKDTNEDASDEESPSELSFVKTMLNSRNTGDAYSAKTEMKKRSQHLKKMCRKYNDFFLPEKVVVEHQPQYQNFIYQATQGLVMCPIKQIASRSLNSLIFRIKGQSSEEIKLKKQFEATYPKSMKKVKKAILVRHPMERIISAYRHNFEQSFDPNKNEMNAGKMSFLDFVDIILFGSDEFNKFLEEHSLEGGSLALDTGMIDGKGQSNAWNPYWKQCGLCHPHFQPDFIMDLANLKKDGQVLSDMLGNPQPLEDWLNVEIENVSANQNVEEHYFSQLTKSEIRALYEKYRIDHELFGYSPDYYIAMGQEDS